MRKPTKKVAKKYVTNHTAIVLLTHAVKSLDDYHGQAGAYQRRTTGRMLKELKALLREEKRGWLD